MTAAEHHGNLLGLRSLVVNFEVVEIVLLFHITAAESLVHFVRYEVGERRVVKKKKKTYF